MSRNASIWKDLTDATAHLATSWMVFQMTIQPTVSVSIYRINCPRYTRTLYLIFFTKCKSKAFCMRNCLKSCQVTTNSTGDLIGNKNNYFHETCVKLLNFMKPGTIGTCPEDDIIPPTNGGITCGVVNVYEEYCSAYCDLGYEILGSTEEYIKCNLGTGWQWSYVVDGNPPPICMRRYRF